jgi:hypothetical protein
MTIETRDTRQLNTHLSRVAEGTGPVMPGNLHNMQGAKSCGGNREMSKAKARFCDRVFLFSVYITLLAFGGAHVDTLERGKKHGEISVYVRIRDRGASR